MQSVSSPDAGVTSLPGSYFGLEGNQKGLEFGREIITAIAGVPLVTRQGSKAMYHAGAVMASNYLVVLLDLAVKMLAEAGVDRDQALAALAVLAQGTLQNVRAQGIPTALTGPIDRGDVGTVQEHLAALRDEHGLKNTYLVLGKYALELAKQKQRSKPIDYTYMMALFDDALSKSER
jgi:predicted short-subunit dehydrogenase-like oxidoreductase (DUF2520 family)